MKYFFPLLFFAIILIGGAWRIFCTAVPLKGMDRINAAVIGTQTFVSHGTRSNSFYLKIAIDKSPYELYINYPTQTEAYFDSTIIKLHINSEYTFYTNSFDANDVYEIRQKATTIYHKPKKVGLIFGILMFIVGSIGIIVIRPISKRSKAANSSLPKATNLKE